VLDSWCPLEKRVLKGVSILMYRTSQKSQSIGNKSGNKKPPAK
jgi:hypothetical protein